MRLYIGYLSRAVAIMIMVTTDNVPARLKGSALKQIVTGHEVHA